MYPLGKWGFAPSDTRMRVCEVRPELYRIRVARNANHFRNTFEETIQRVFNIVAAHKVAVYAEPNFDFAMVKQRESDGGFPDASGSI